MFGEMMKPLGATTAIGLLIPEQQLYMITKHIKTRPYNMIVLTGDEHNVLERYANLYKKIRPDYVMRITGDCPAWNPFLAQELLINMMKHHADYGLVSTPDDYPDGLDVEFIRADLMEKLIESKEIHAGILEHVTISFRGSKGPKPTTAFRLPPREEFKSYPKLSIDTVEDLDTLLQWKDRLWWLNN